MAKIVVLTGSPRKHGNSNTLADTFLAEAARLGHETVRIDTTALQVLGCRACNGCYQNGRPCALDNGYNQIAAELDTADGIVLVCPVYWYTFPAQLKAVIDKWYSLSYSGRSFRGKKAALISCCGDREPDTFTGVQFAFAKTMELLEAQIVGEVLIPNVDAPDDILKTDGPECARALAALF